MKNRFRQRIPNFIEHNPADLLDIEFDDISEWMDTTFYKWYANNPDFSHFAIMEETWYDRRMTVAVFDKGYCHYSFVGWFDKPDEVDLPKWSKE